MTAYAFPARLESKASVRNIRRERIDVALQAEKPSFPAQQELALDGAVRAVARRASLHFDRGMLIQEGTALFGVTGNAHLEIGFF